MFAHFQFIRCVQTFLFMLATAAVYGEGVPWTVGPNECKDATLRDSVAASVDRIWAVGDRGLVMASRDGGRTWTQPELTSGVNLTGIAFANSQRGWIVGGFAWPLTGRSDGTVLRTTDGGEHWKPVEGHGLGRLSGVQVLGEMDVMAWGDWSNVHQSSLFESHDGGETFVARPVPCSHLTCSAWLNPVQGVIVDRLSRVFVCSDGRTFEQLNLPSKPTSPIRDAASDGASIWLVGADCQIYRSRNLQTWERIKLAVAAEDAEILDLQSITIKDNHVWISTNLPGTLLSSFDGESFSVHHTGCPVPLKTVCAVTSEHAIACGEMCNIVETRNAGQGWWMKHQLGQRQSMLAVVARISDLPIDALVHDALAEMKHVAALVVHSQNNDLKADVWTDDETRASEIAATVNASKIETLSDFPIGNLRGTNPRSLDLAGYSRLGNQPSNVEKRLVVAIRTSRPDIIVMNSDSDPISTACNVAILEAIQLASVDSYSPFVAESEFELPAWKVQRIVRRSPRRASNSLADWTVEATELLGSSGLTVADRVRIAAALTTSTRGIDELFDLDAMPTKATREVPASGLLWNNISLYGDYWGTRGGKRPVSQASSYYAGLPVDPASQRTIGQSKLRNLQVLGALLKQQQAFDVLSDADLSTQTQREKWLMELSNHSGSLASDDRSRLLLELGIVSLKRGDLYAWRKSLDYLMLEPKTTVWKEIGSKIAIQFAASGELEYAFGAGYREAMKTVPLKLAAASTPARQSTVQPAAFVSPFEQVKNRTDSSPKVNVVNAEYVSNASDTIFAEAPLLGFGIAPDVFEKQVAISVVNRLDLRSQLVTNSLNRRRASGKDSYETPLRSIAASKGLLGWEQLVNREYPSLNQPNGLSDAKKMAGNTSKINSPLNAVFTLQRPTLDGKLDEPFWDIDKAVKLESPWPEDFDQAALVFFACDDDFIYVATRCPTKLDGDSKVASIASLEKTKTRTRDADVREQDHVRIRLDIDRDYLTYFELAVSRSGDTYDRLNFISKWDPKWYVANQQFADHWVAEIAIPRNSLFRELQPESLTDEVIAVNLHRSMPGIGVQNSQLLPCDAMLPQSSQLLFIPAHDATGASD